MILKDFYEVSDTSHKDGLQYTSLKINKDHEIYKGHFPGRPVTPGVVLMQLFKEEAARVFNKKLELARADNVKFTSVFDPNQSNLLMLESQLEETGDFIKLKGIAKNEKGIVLKISALYRLI